MSLLIPRLYDPLAGEILLDGYNLKKLSLKTISSCVGIVLQETYLFYDSILNNLKFVKEDATEEEIINACKSANIYDTIMEMDDKFETVIG